MKNRTSISFVIDLDFSYGDNGTFSPTMDVTNQIQNGMQHTSGNSNYSSGSGGDSPTSLSPSKCNGCVCFFLHENISSRSNVIRSI